MTKLSFPMRARAYVSLQIKPSIEEVTGFRKDGTPIIKRTPQYTNPGDEFLIEDERVYRELVPTGYCALLDDDGAEINIGPDGRPVDFDA